MKYVPFTRVDKIARTPIAQFLNSQKTVPRVLASLAIPAQYFAIIMRIRFPRYVGYACIGFRTLR